MMFSMTSNHHIIILQKIYSQSSWWQWWHGLLVRVPPHFQYRRGWPWQKEISRFIFFNSESASSHKCHLAPVWIGIAFMVTLILQWLKIWLTGWRKVGIPIFTALKAIHRTCTQNSHICLFQASPHKSCFKRSISLEFHEVLLLWLEQGEEIS